ncbi:MAG: response regulator [Elusimicrobia bacterium]|nr:response regulator [Elusimicrobiota bacterium]MBD3411870.1 response regulator [Elusimicrobiota bacterium]
MKKILIVEDEPILREIFCEGLMREGFHVDTAKNGAEARKYFYHASKPDLLIMDIKLPDDSGIRLFQEFRKIIPDLMVMVITAYDCFQSDYELWSANIAAYMVKPINLDDLISKVRQILPE